MDSSGLMDQTLALLKDDWVIFALPLFLTALLIEWVVAWRKSLALYERRDFMASMGVMLLTVVIDVLPKLGGVLLMFVCWEASPLKEVVSRAPAWWVILFFLDDLTYYSFHRANHEVRFLWAGTCVAPQLSVLQLRHGPSSGRGRAGLEVSVLVPAGVAGL